MEASGYTLDLYCDHENQAHEWNEFPHQFCSERRADCVKDARRRGWIFHRDGQRTCPKCARKSEPRR